MNKPLWLCRKRKDIVPRLLPSEALHCPMMLPATRPSPEMGSYPLTSSIMNQNEPLCFIKLPTSDITLLYEIKLYRTSPKLHLCYSCHLPGQSLFMHGTFLGIWGQEQGLVPLSTVLGMDMPQRGSPVWTGQFINIQHVKASFTSLESQQGLGVVLDSSHQSLRFSVYHM